MSKIYEIERKSKSPYVRETKTIDSDIFKQDYYTIVTAPSPNSGIEVRGTNFKVLVSKSQSAIKKYNKKRVKNVGYKIEKIVDDSKLALHNIPILPKSYSIADYAYYGSAVELIKASITDIVNRFPGAIVYPEKDSETITVNNVDYYFMSNEFNIDYDITVNENLLIYTDEDCNNHLMVKKSYIDSNESLCGTILYEPSDEVKAAFWNSLNDFQKILLNRSTTPIYRADFDYQYQNNDGFFTEKRNYSWPTVGNTYSIKASGTAFSKYVNDLVEMASFYDEYDSDNIWRMLVHESVKNMDSTIISKNGTDTDFSLDSSRIQAIIEIYGRAFDDIKRDVDNIKSLKTITYSGNESMPLDDLKEAINEKGWATTDVSPSYDIVLSGTNEVVIKTNDDIYGGVSVGLTPSMVNNEFMKRLALNSTYIHSMKGTRKGLEAILGLFGYECVSATTTAAGEYNITEYVGVVSGSSFFSPDDFYCLKAQIGNTQYDNEFTDGYPVKDIVISGLTEEDELRCMVPWFEPGKYYNNESLYFQSKGGWGEMDNKKVEYNGVTIPLSGMSIYKESVPKIYFVENPSDLIDLAYRNDLANDSVCYVQNVNASIGESNYYILIDANYYTNISGEGWRNIPESDFNTENLSREAKVVLYKESLLFETEGNNPHNGNNLYDDGDEFITDLSYPFRKLIDSSLNFECMDPENRARLFDFGFNVNRKIDNVKCHYFAPQTIDSEDTDEFYSDDNFYDDLQIHESADTQDKKTELASYSVVNLKNIVINFGTNGNDVLKDYIQNIVINYLELMVPSTTIVKYTFDGKFEVDNSSQVITETDRIYSMSSAAQAFTSGNDYVVDEGGNRSDDDLGDNIVDLGVISSTPSKPKSRNKKK